jgi:uncharacterized protein
MPEYLTPGVYIEEIEIGAKPIEGVSTSTAAFLGRTERGPLEPRLITSFDQFQKLYGGYLPDSFLAYEVEGFFRNGGSRCFISRIVGGSSTPGNTATKGFYGSVMRVTAAAQGVKGNDIFVKIDDAPSGTADPLAFVLTVYKPVEYNLSADPNTTKTDFPYYIKSGAAGPDVSLSRTKDGKPKALVMTALKGGSDDAPASLDISGESENVMKVTAAASGVTGNDIFVKIDDAPSGTSDPLAFVLIVYETVEHRLSADPKTTSTDFPYYIQSGAAGPNVSLSFINPGKPNVLSKKALSGGSDVASASLEISGDIKEASKPKSELIISALGPGTSGANIRISIQTAGLSSLDAHLFKLVVSYNKIEEVYDNLSIDSSSSDYYLNRVNGISNLIVISPGQSISRPLDISNDPLTGGNDATPVTKADYEGCIIDDKTGKRTGWLALDRINDISIYCEPVESESTLQKSLTDSVINHCVLMKDRFAVLQTPQGTTSDIANLFPPKDSKYAALYHPWISILDPLTDLPKYVPPSGHIAGIYARTDGLRGVHKAPANETVSGIVDLKFDIQKGEQDILNPRGVNCIRAFQGQGIKVWGARTISRDPLWKYVNVRRLFIYLEKSINQGTQWVVFEPNNEALWSRVKQTICQFLTTVWRSGALMGSTEDEAFFVKCDRTTMTQDDIDNGRLIVLVGVAPVKPAEFVIFRIAQVANAVNTV